MKLATPLLLSSSILLLSCSTEVAEVQKAAIEARPFVVLCFDVEDYTSPESVGMDDIPKWLAETMTDVGATLNGKLFDLPGGPLGAVIGGEARWEEGFTQPDNMITGKDSAGNLQDATAGAYNAQEAFMEVSLPLVSKSLAKSGYIVVVS